MASSTNYKPEYSSSRALIIGINDYKLTSPLGYAEQDAEGFAEALKTRFAFPPDNVTVLLNAEATRERIYSEFLALAKDSVQPDDRIAFFLRATAARVWGEEAKSGFSFRWTGTRAIWRA
jgi:hypothetical protein